MAGSLFFVGMVTQGLVDGFKTSRKITDIQWDQAFLGEVVKDIRAAKIEWKAAAEKSVGEFFSPVMRRVVVLYCQVVAEGVKGFDFGLDVPMAVTEDLHIRQLYFQATGEFVAQEMQRVSLLFGRADRGEIPGFICGELAARVLVRFAVKPDHPALGQDRIGVGNSPWFLAGEHMAELGKKSLAVDLDGRGL